MRVVIVGAGKIGCGYLAPLFADHGHEVVLGCRTAQSAARFAAAGHWRVRVTGPSGGVRTVSGVRAVAVGSPSFRLAVAGADLVVVAVGVGNVAQLGPDLARALAARPAGDPIDVWVVENDDCAPVLERSVAAAAERQGVRLPPIGFASAVAWVTVGRGSWRDPGTPEFVRDSADRLVVDARRLRTTVPAPGGVVTTSQYRARLDEKLYVFNAGHALCAYVGWLRGHETISSAVRDVLVRPIVAGCLLEARRAVLTAHPGLAAGSRIQAAVDIHPQVADALRRYEDAQLADPITRVAREPLRKLQPTDRLIGPARLIRETTGHTPAHVALGVAAALLYGRGAREVADPQARELRGLLARHGVMAVLRDVCGLDSRDPLAQTVAARYRGFVFVDDGVMFPPVHAADSSHSYARRLQPVAVAG